MLVIAAQTWPALRVTEALYLEALYHIVDLKAALAPKARPALDIFSLHHTDLTLGRVTGY